MRSTPPDRVRRGLFSPGSQTPPPAGPHRSARERGALDHRQGVHRRRPPRQPLSPVRLVGGPVVLRGVLLAAGPEPRGQIFYRPAHADGVIGRRRPLRRGGLRRLRRHLGRRVRLWPRGRGRVPVAPAVSGRRPEGAAIGRWLSRTASPRIAECNRETRDRFILRRPRCLAPAETGVGRFRNVFSDSALRESAPGVAKMARHAQNAGYGVIGKRLSRAWREAPHDRADRADSGRQSRRLSRPSRLIRRPVRPHGGRSSCCNRTLKPRPMPSVGIEVYR